MLATIGSAALLGIDAVPVSVEVNTGESGVPDLVLVGLPDSAVKESEDRVVSALSNSGLRRPHTRTTINLAPGDLRKEGAIYDLPIALGILVATNQLVCDNLGDYLIAGELSLSGATRPIKGGLAMAVLARETRRKAVLLPPVAAQEAALVEGLRVYEITSLDQATRFLAGQLKLAPLAPPRSVTRPPAGGDQEPDFADIKGQHAVRRAVEVAVAGGHNLIKLSTVIQQAKKRPSKPSPQGVLSGHALAVENARKSGIYVDSRGWRYSVSRSMPGVASDYIAHLPELLARTVNRRVVLCCRVSYRTQERKGNLQDAVMNATEALEMLGCEVVDVVADVENSRISNPQRPSLERALSRAQWLEAILVFPERDRALRHAAYRGKLRHSVTGRDLETPSIGEFRLLARKAAGVPLATLTHPDAPARTAQIKRGQRHTPAPPGRPKDETQGPGKFVRRKAALVEFAVELRRQSYSYRQIAERINQSRRWPPVSFSQVGKWCVEAGV